MKLTRAARISKLGIAAKPGEVEDNPLIAWLLKDVDSGRIVLVDSGPSDDPARDSKFHNPVTRTPEQQLEAQLHKYGVEPEQVTEVILTHLHWDHAYGLYKLPNAKIYVQRSEVQYAIAPFTIHKACYELNDTSRVPFFCDFVHRFVLLDSDLEFAPGIRLIQLPGHSPGSQGVLVDTPNGTYLIAGDLFNYMPNLEQDIPTGVNTSLYDCAASFAKVRAMKNVTILPAHDFVVYDLLKVFQ